MAFNFVKLLHIIITEKKGYTKNGCDKGAAHNLSLYCFLRSLAPKKKSIDFEYVVVISMVGHFTSKTTCSRGGIKHVSKRYWVMSTEIAHFILQP